MPVELCTETNKDKFIRLGERTQYHSNEINAIYGKDYEFDKVIENIDPSLNGRITIEDAKVRSAARKTRSNKSVDCEKRN